jgi:hypothetical protein
LPRVQHTPVLMRTESKGKKAVIFVGDMQALHALVQV